MGGISGCRVDSIGDRGVGGSWSALDWAIMTKWASGDVWSERDRAEYECWLATHEPAPVPRWVEALAIGVRVVIIGGGLAGIGAMVWFLVRVGIAVGNL